VKNAAFGAKIAANGGRHLRFTTRGYLFQILKTSSDHIRTLHVLRR